MGYNITEIRHLHRVAAECAARKERFLPVFERMEEILVKAEAMETRDPIQIARMRLAQQQVEAAA